MNPTALEFAGPPHGRLAGKTGITLLLLASAISAAAGESFEVLHTFGTNPVGTYPSGGLTPGRDGFVYGTALTGGAANCGQVFKVRPDGSDYTSLKDFSGPDGNAPVGGVLVDGPWVYGVTQYGGTNGGPGTVFKVGSNGENFTILKHFKETDGSYPHARPQLSGNTLYGTAYQGGSGLGGTVFKLNTEGGEFTVLKNFTGGLDGGGPYGGVVVSGDTLYGATCLGGEFSKGTLFMLKADGSGFTVLKDFKEVDGRLPEGDLLLDKGVLYGVLAYGGTNDGGTVYAINIDGTGFRVLHYFEGANTIQPFSGLVLSDAMLYGSTAGVSGLGAIYKIGTNGTGFEVLKADGPYPSALAISGKTIYGTLNEGGPYGRGALFSMNTDGTAYKSFFVCSGGDGERPIQKLLLEAGTLYGITEGGGGMGWGTLFKIGTNGSGYAVIKNFTNYSEGIFPQSSPVLLGNTLYGTAGYGGAMPDDWVGTNDCGTVYRVGIDGEGFALLHRFDFATAAYPKGSLTMDGGTLFGATRFAGSLDATIYKVQTNGSDFTVLKTFRELSEGEPDGGLLISGSVIYGTAWNTPAHHGMIYRINTDGSGYRVLKHFSGEDGSYPLGGLVLSGSALYGVTEGGGGPGFGTVFRLNTDGTGFGVLHVFNGAEGAQPKAPLLLSGSALYGTTTSGGVFQTGTIFKINTNGTSFAVLKHLPAAYPQAGLTAVGDNLYGTCSCGGISDSGLLFRFSPGPPVIELMPDGGQSGSYGDVVELFALVSGYPEPACQWRHNGTNVPGATAARLTLTGVTAKDSGLYTLVVTNAYGTVTSPPIALSVMEPVLVEQPAALTVKSGQSAAFSAVAKGTVPLVYRWFKGSTALQDAGRIYGAQASSLMVSNAVLADEGVYRLVVSNSYGVAESDGASLTVQDPYIISGPANTNIPAGRAGSLSVLAGGTGTWEYQWFKNGQSLPGATGPALVFAAARASDAGVYTVAVTNGNRRVESGSALVTVNLAIPDAFAPSAPVVNSLALQPDGRVIFSSYPYDPAGPYVLTRLNDDGSIDPTFRPVLNQQVRAIAVQPDGRIVIGGDFTEVNGRPAVRIARLNPSGTLDDGFAANCNSPVYALVLQSDGKIVIGGAFGIVNVVSCAHIARLKANGTLDESFFPAASALVTCLALQPDGKILVGGNFSLVNYSERRMLARLNANGSLDTGFVVSPNPEISASVSALALQPDGKIVVSGWWSVTSGQGGSFRLARVDTNGRWDEGFSAFVNQDCTSLAVQPDGKVLVGGFFTNLCESPVSYLGRLLPDGRIDPTFNPAPNSTVLSLLLQQVQRFPESMTQPHVRLLVGGQFDAIGGQARSGLGRLDLLHCPQPVVLPAAQTAESGTVAGLWVRDQGYPTPCYQWSSGGVALSGQTNPVLWLAASPAFAGSYTVTASNVADCGTSAPAVLSIIPPVNRRIVPAIPAPDLNVPPMHVEFSGDLRQTNWTALESFIVGEGPKQYLDRAAPLPGTRFYRGWRDMSRPPLRLSLSMVPELTLTGSPGDSVRIECIKPIGPTNAWVTLATLTLTNATQQYYDLTYHGGGRLYQVITTGQNSPDFSE